MFTIRGEIATLSTKLNSFCRVFFLLLRRLTHKISIKRELRLFTSFFLSLRSIRRTTNSFIVFHSFFFFFYSRHKLEFFWSSIIFVNHVNEITWSDVAGDITKKKKNDSLVLLHCILFKQHFLLLQIDDWRYQFDDVGNRHEHWTVANIRISWLFDCIFFCRQLRCAFYYYNFCIYFFFSRISLFLCSE